MSVKFIKNQKEIDKLTKAIAENLGQSIEQTAKEIVPVKTGTLRDSITHQTKGVNEVEIKAETPYAVYIELGTSFMEAQPYLRPAVMKWQRNMKKVK